MGKTVGLMICFANTICGVGKVVILVSGFCVLKALIALKTYGIFAAAVINKALLA
jgi:hypothetical protein